MSLVFDDGVNYNCNTSSWRVCYISISLSGTFVYLRRLMMINDSWWLCYFVWNNALGQTDCATWLCCLNVYYRSDARHKMSHEFPKCFEMYKSCYKPIKIFRALFVVLSCIIWHTSVCVEVCLNNKRSMIYLRDDWT